MPPQTRVRKWLRSWSFWAILILVLGSSVRLAREIKTIQKTPVSSWSTDPSADCAVVLTGGVGRVRDGFDLLANHHVKKLIISGVHPDARMRDLMPAWAFYGDLREEDVVLEKRSETTWGNAQQSLPIVEALRCRDVVLVTSRTHMSRAYRTFRAVFPDSIEIQNEAVVGNRFDPTWVELFIEAVKSVFYSLWAY